MRGRAQIAALAVALLGLLPLTGGRARAADDRQPVPQLQARVTDLTGTLSAAEQAQLEQRLAEFEQRKGAQFAVLLVPTTAPEAIEQYSIRVAEAWKLGRKGTDDGLLLLLAKDDHGVRFEVGYGLEGVLPDAIANRIIDETMVPLLREGQYYHAIDAGLGQAMRIVEGEQLPPPDAKWRGRALPQLFPGILIGVLVASAVLRATRAELTKHPGSGTAQLFSSLSGEGAAEARARTELPISGPSTTACSWPWIRRIRCRSGNCSPPGNCTPGWSR